MTRKDITEFETFKIEDEARVKAQLEVIETRVKRNASENADTREARID